MIVSIEDLSSQMALACAKLTKDKTQRWSFERGVIVEGIQVIGDALSRGTAGP